MNCQTCGRETTTVTIGTSPYCAVCGNRLGDDTSRAISGSRSLDLRPKGVATVINARGTTAHALHAAPASAHTLDLRGKAPAKTKKLVSTRPRTTAPAAPESPPAVNAVSLSKHPDHAEPQPHPAKHRQPHDPSRVAERHQRAKSVTRSRHISRFGDGARPLEPSQPKATKPEPTFTPAIAAAHSGLARLVPSENTLPPAPKRGQLIGVAAAIAIMAGYVWLENYPKLTMQAAAAKAGVSATAPSYLPTSYSLADTSTSPGLLTLNFKSPSAPSALTIKQQRTNWDSKSLADNFVTRADSNFSTVDGQGLTIYLFNQNQAAWVNHGIWYTIKGAAHLSQDQILKIAYGL